MDSTKTTVNEIIDICVELRILIDDAQQSILRGKIVALNSILNVLRDTSFGWTQREWLKMLLFQQLYPKDWTSHSKTNSRTVAWVSVYY
jgi:hypothetical protein